MTDIHRPFHPLSGVFGTIFFDQVAELSRQRIRIIGFRTPDALSDTSSEPGLPLRIYILGSINSNNHYNEFYFLSLYQLKILKLELETMKKYRQTEMSREFGDHFLVTVFTRPETIDHVVFDCLPKLKFTPDEFDQLKNFLGEVLKAET
ncbi:hypothetical protein A2533_01700 [Candidatus Falkowbacteria bacterium RIFOXYD2_FULL_35_9]|uniref:Uncharacterized protein n=1 Tax=Candidatus Falkowbacteria bacterium RIFOXYC2_FULL_36_12 TaxID=1798002 RepID=A0A1F5T0L5_9BACT|nr:MAG: hypothetical protein A2300_04220 [Candidatus Falkowbacteria bacterium RIFOXYB2_FULL_35_7]OGF32283.1 MAG: hypothetical protein A2478_03075 [Candidatus Falkowbacteria bacterium RIFOXYC2_FULL_36_12]OGF33860.1 MAG: hypothetical protein A2223_01285 [Candidatus Falkowbacteria bacterium RIFOXYA2_FULL_35_8]OGF47953.1 MAG: hypothetical protein A2533_01700 [Candidatus Falkowbacteria bacterium RIFOXYD2_FULL_35_9]